MREIIKIIKKDVLMYLDMLDTTKRHSKCTVKDYIHVRIKYPVFKFVVCMRICYWIEMVKFLKPIYYLLKLEFRHLQIKYGIQTGHRLNPGGGFFIGHFGGIVIHEGATIGERVIIHQNTSIGTTDRGVPCIGNNVTIGANVCIIGNVKIGNNCTIGAGSIVTNFFPDNSILVGNPAKKIGTKPEGGHKF